MILVQLFYIGNDMLIDFGLMLKFIVSMHLIR